MRRSTAFWMRGPLQVKTSLITHFHSMSPLWKPYLFFSLFLSTKVTSSSFQHESFFLSLHPFFSYTFSSSHFFLIHFPFVSLSPLHHSQPPPSSLKAIFHHLLLYFFCTFFPHPFLSFSFFCLFHIFLSVSLLSEWIPFRMKHDFTANFPSLSLSFFSQTNQLTHHLKIPSSFSRQPKNVKRLLGLKIDYHKLNIRTKNERVREEREERKRRRKAMEYEDWKGNGRRGRLSPFPFPSCIFLLPHPFKSELNAGAGHGSTWTFNFFSFCPTKLERKWEGKERGKRKERERELEGKWRKKVERREKEERLVDSDLQVKKEGIISRHLIFFLTRINDGLWMRMK